MSAPIDYKSDYVPGGFRLTGPRVLGILVLFFGTIGAVDATMMHYALSTHRGETVEHPYESGLAYNKEIAAANAQKALQWSVEAHAELQQDGTTLLIMSARDSSGKAVTALDVKAMLKAPADTKGDLAASLTEREPGQYSGILPAHPGQWWLTLEADRAGARVFMSNNRVILE